MTSDKAALLILSAIIVFGFGGVLVVWMFYPPVGDSNLFAGLTGALAAGYLQVIGFWFNKKDS